MKKRLSVLILTFLFMLSMVSSVFATYKIGYEEGVWHEIAPLNGTSPSSATLLGSVTLRIDTFRGGNSLVNFYHSYFGTLDVNMTVTGGLYDRTLRYKTPAGVYINLSQKVSGDISVVVWKHIQIVTRNMGVGTNTTVTIHSDDGDFADQTVLDIPYVQPFSSSISNNTDGYMHYAYKSDGSVASLITDPSQELSLKASFISPVNNSQTTKKDVDAVFWYMIPVLPNAVPADVTIDTTGSNGGLITFVSHVVTFYIDANNIKWAQGVVKYTQHLTGIIGTTTLRATASSAYNGNTSCSDTHVISLVMGSVDANGDGLDDRTNESTPLAPVVPVKPTGLELPVRTDYETGIFGSINFAIDSMIAYIKAPFSFIGNTLESMLNWFSESASWISSVTSFFGAIFGFLPAPITGALITIFGIIATFTILRIIRGDHMLDFLQIVINLIWSVMSISIPMTSTLSFTIWQFFITIMVIAVSFHQLMQTANKGGK